MTYFSKFWKKLEKDATEKKMTKLMKKLINKLMIATQD